MASLRGQYEYSLDDKSRLMIPAKLRKKIDEEFGGGDQFVLVRGSDQCLEIFPKVVWDKVESKLSERSSFDQQARTLRRLFATMIDDVEMDKQGRVIIPKRFLEFAGIEKEVVMLGAGEKIEVWNPGRLEENIKKTISQFEGLAEQVLSADGK